MDTTILIRAAAGVLAVAVLAFLIYRRKSAKSVGRFIMSTTRCLKNITRDTTVGSHIAIADTSLTRLVGLVGKRRLDAGCGLLLKPSSGVHTFGMLFAIDVVGLSEDLRVLRLWESLAPFRLTSLNFKMRSVLELPAGQIRHSLMQVGDQLAFQSNL